MKIKLMSHNVWGMYAPDVVKEVANRNELMRQIYFDQMPDVIGTQEFSEDIRRHELPEMLAPHFVELDVSVQTTEYGMKNLFTPIFYCPETCEPVKSGFVLYDRAFNNQDSKGATWAVFRHLPDGELFTVCNTHYWWRSGPEHDLARVENSRVILNLMQELPAPFFVMGDLNCRVDSAAYQTLLAGGLADAQAAAPDTMDSNTHHAYPMYDSEKHLFFGSPKPEGDYSSSIDHILVDLPHADCVSQFTVDLSDNACNTSDHCPVWIEAEL